MQATRSLTPQPWHPDYQRDGSRSSTPNPLDLPEHRRRRSSDESHYDLSEIDLDDRNNDKKSEKSSYRQGSNNNDDDDDGHGPVLKKTRKNIFSRFRRNRVKKVSGDGKAAGTGRIAQFSNERLFLHWIRFGILQGSLAVTLLSFGDGIPAYVGVGAIVLALLTLIYSTTLYHLRHLYMITKRQDVKYQATLVPTLLCVALILLYATNLVVNLVIGKAATSVLPYADEQEKFGHYF
ncbi:vacuolar transporter chaperone [Mortierella sp. AM989]|nr:vacuolar transporter chaperone [Mortierella sp. AM989]